MIPSQTNQSSAKYDTSMLRRSFCLAYKVSTDVQTEILHCYKPFSCLKKASRHFHLELKTVGGLG